MRGARQAFRYLIFACACVVALGTPTIARERVLRFAAGEAIDLNTLLAR